MTVVREDGSVEFRFFRPGASHVTVAGDFTGWKDEILSMQSLGDGWWVAQAALPPGEYRFRYRADGNWYTDYASHGVEATPMGWNGVLVVPRARHAAVRGHLTLATGGFSAR